MKAIILAILILSLPVSLASAQAHINQRLYWIRYQNQLILSPAVYWTNEIDNRRFFAPDVQNQLIYHSRLHFKRNRWDFAGGLSYSLAYSAIPGNGYRKPLAELRPVAEGSHEFKVKRFFIQNRVRFDNRFFQEERGISLLEDSDFVLRYRYRIQVRFSVKKNQENMTTIGLRVGDEIMFNSKQNVFDQNRVYINVEGLITRNISLEGGYLYIYQQRFGRDDFFNRHIVRFSFLHKVFVR